MCGEKPRIPITHNKKVRLKLATPKVHINFVNLQSVEIS